MIKSGFFLILIFFISGSAQAQQSCVDLFVQHGLNLSGLTVADILPEALDISLKKQLPDISYSIEINKLEATEFDAQESTQVSILARSSHGYPQEIISFTLAEVETYRLAVDWVGLNALRIYNGETARPSMDEHQGLSLQTFAQLQERLIKIAREKGYTQIIGRSPINYLVASLYRRRGFTPANELSAKLYEITDRAYEQARKFLPEKYRPKGAAEFANIIEAGIYSVNEADIFIALEDGKSFRDDKGNTFAVLINKYGKDIVVLLAPLQPGQSQPKKLQWIGFDLASAALNADLILDIRE